MISAFRSSGGLFELELVVPGAQTVTIPTRSGQTYNALIDWGDGASSHCTAHNTGNSRSYAAGGTYRVAIRGLFPSIFFNNGGDKDLLSEVHRIGAVGQGANQNAAFHGCSSLTALDISGWNTANVTNFGEFARACTNLTALDVSGWNTSNVTTFNRFVVGCNSLTALDVSGWDTSNVTDFGFFARFCNSLTALDVSGWNTSNVTAFSYLVQGCTSLTTLDLSGWDTANVTDFSNFAQGCTSLTALDVGNAFAASPCVNYTNAFTGCALNQTSVDAILVSINNAGTSDGTLTIRGGTSATPSATGQTAADALIGRGWTVSLN